MAVIDPLARSNALIVSAAAARVGIILEEHEDLAGFGEAYAALGRGPITPIIEAEPHPAVGWWCAFRDTEGRLVGCQGMRMLGSLEVDLYTHLVTRLSDYLPLEPGMAVERSEVISAVARELDGDAVYHSSFYLSPAVRGRGTAALLFRHAQLAAWQRWQPDLFFGIAIPNSNNPTFAARMGYSGYEPEAFIWRDEVGEEQVREGLVWSGRTQMRTLVRDPLDGLPARYSELFEEGQRAVGGDLGHDRQAARAG